MRGSGYVCHEQAHANPEGVADRTSDEAAEQLLRMLGAPLDEAREIATAPLPDLSAVSQV